MSRIIFVIAFIISFPFLALRGFERVIRATQHVNNSENVVVTSVESRMRTYRSTISANHRSSYACTVTCLHGKLLLVRACNSSTSRHFSDIADNYTIRCTFRIFSNSFSITCTLFCGYNLSLDFIQMIFQILTTVSFICCVSIIHYS